MNRITGAIFAFFLFFYLYTPDLKGFPISIRVSIAILGIGASIIHLIVSLIRRGENLTLRKSYLQFWFIYLLFVCWAAFVIFINGSSDVIIARDNAVRLAVLFGGGYFLVLFLKNLRPGTSVADILRFYVVVIVVQCLIAVFTFAFPAAKNFVDGIQRESADPVLSNLGQKIGLIRMGGLGMSFFGAGVDCSLALITICALARLSSWTVATTLRYSLSFIFIAGVGLFMARTTLVGVAMSFVFLMVPFGPGGSKNRLLASVSLLLVAAILFLVPYLLTSDKYGMVLNFALEGFINFFSYGSLETESSNDLKHMFVLPTNIRTYILGDGYMNNPLVPGGYYMGVDVGYLRLLYFGGLGYVFLWFYFHHFLMRPKTTETNLRLYYRFVMILILLVNVKGIADFYPYLILLFIYEMFRSAGKIGPAAKDQESADPALQDGGS